MAYANLSRNPAWALTVMTRRCPRHARAIRWSISRACETLSFRIRFFSFQFQNSSGK
jgi:hypothetical protein